MRKRGRVFFFCLGGFFFFVGGGKGRKNPSGSEKESWKRTPVYSLMWGKTAVLPPSHGPVEGSGWRLCCFLKEGKSCSFVREERCFLVVPGREKKKKKAGGSWWKRKAGTVVAVPERGKREQGTVRNSPGGRCAAPEKKGRRLP